MGFILLIVLALLYIRYRKKKLRDLNNNKQIDAVWANSANSISSQALRGITIDDSHESDVFTLENSHIFGDPKYKLNELQEDLEQLTLVDTELDSKSKSNNRPK